MKTLLSKISRWLRFNLLYLGRPPWDTGVSPPELKRFLKKSTPGRALDVGCGTGTNLATMAEAGWEVVGMDIAWLSVLRARRKLHRHGLDGRVLFGDVTNQPDVHPPFDLILDIGCYHSLTPSGREAYRAKVRDWLRPGGTLLMYAHLHRGSKATHGISDKDLEAFQTFLNLQWSDENDEVRPQGGGGFPSIWVRFNLIDKK